MKSTIQQLCEMQVPFAVIAWYQGLSANIERTARVEDVGTSTQYEIITLRRFIAPVKRRELGLNLCYEGLYQAYLYTSLFTKKDKIWFNENRNLFEKVIANYHGRVYELKDCPFKVMYNQTCKSKKIRYV